MLINCQAEVRPPSFPLRPVNGGPLPNARPKFGVWTHEPKINGWRAWLHTPTRLMFNRKNEPLSITHEFKPIIEKVRAAKLPLVWLDVEALERRHNLGRGSLVLLDFAPGTYESGYHLSPRWTYDERQQVMYEILKCGVATKWHYLHEPPPENSLLTFAYTFTDYGLTKPTEEQWLPDQNMYEGEDHDGIHTGWRLLQRANQVLGAEVFEGLVAKRNDSQYPLQLRSHEQEFPFWMKHRWAF